MTRHADGDASSLRGAPSRPRRLRLALAVVASIVVLAALGLASITVRSAEVVAEGQLLTYTDATIKEVRLFDRYTVYVEAEVRSDKDAAVSALLVAVAAMAFLVAAFLWFGRVRARPIDRAFYAVTAAAAGYLAVDESLGVHETLGHNLRFLADLPGVERPDDAVVVLYAVLVLAYFAAFRAAILVSRRALVLFAGAFALFVLSAAFDVLGLVADEYLEPLAALTFVAGFVVLCLDHLAAAVDA